MDAAAQAYARWHAAHDKLNDLLQGEQDRLRMVDLWTYQRNEIEQARLQPGEDEALETEKRVLANAEKLYAAALSGFDLLYEGGASAEVALKAAIHNVEELARYDTRFAESAQQLASARATISDLAASLRDYAEGINASPERLAEIEDRLALLDRLKRKYGKTVGEVIAFGEDVAGKLAEVEDRDEILKTLRAALEQASAEYQKAASAFTAERKAAATKLAKLSEAHINSLAMKTRFSVSVTASHTEAAWTPSGWDTVEYLIAPNPGEPLKPLIEIASGGELSRILLALKVAVEESSSKSRRKRLPARWSSTKSTSVSEAERQKLSAKSSRPSAARSRFCASRICRKSPPLPISIWP